MYLIYFFITIVLEINILILFEVDKLHSVPSSA